MREYEELKAQYSSNQNKFNDIIGEQKKLKPNEKEYVLNEIKSKSKNESNNKEYINQFQATKSLNEVTKYSTNPNSNKFKENNTGFNESKYDLRGNQDQYLKTKNLLKSVYSNTVKPLSNDINKGIIIGDDISKINKINYKGDIKNIHKNMLLGDENYDYNNNGLDTGVDFLFENIHDKKFVLNENLFKKTKKPMTKTLTRLNAINLESKVTSHKYDNKALKKTTLPSTLPISNRTRAKKMSTNDYELY